MIVPHVPSFQTVVGPFIWRFGMVTNASVPGKPGRRDDHMARIREVNAGRVRRDDLEIVEILTTILPCLR